MCCCPSVENTQICEANVAVGKKIIVLGYKGVGVKEEGKKEVVGLTCLHSGRHGTDGQPVCRAGDSTPYHSVLGWMAVIDNTGQESIGNLLLLAKILQINVNKCRVTHPIICQVLTLYGM